jgi:hypothetical protein
VALLGSDLGQANTSNIAVIEKSTNPNIASDPLLRGVAATVPGRNWFDVVVPQRGARVLANYRLSITPAAASRLKKAGFPSRYITGDGRNLVFPAAVAGRDGDVSNGQLRSLYVSGDATGYPAVSQVAERFPALGGIEEALSSRYGSFSSRYYWSFYKPMLHNVFADTPRLRYQ